ncbi:MAG: hypothetical protein V1775_00355 [Bacteroidota bacterium]
MSEKEMKKQENSLWAAFEDYMNENYWPGVMESSSSEAIAFEWKEFSSNVSIS